MNEYVNNLFDPTLNWADIAWLKRLVSHHIPLYEGSLKKHIYRALYNPVLESPACPSLLKVFSLQKMPD